MSSREVGEVGWVWGCACRDLLGLRQGRALPGPLLDLTSTVVVSISNAMVSYSTFSEMRVITGIICI